jgi:thiol-disulfide isomerase/thioredoxin
VLDRFLINPEVPLQAIDKSTKEVEFSTAPPFRLTDSGGNEVSIADFASKVVVVNFWSSTCAPCIEEFPSLVRYIKKFSGKVVLLAVSQDQDAASMSQFLERYYTNPDPNIYVLLDMNRGVAKAYGVTALPESFLFAKDLKFKRKIVGFRDWMSPVALQETAALINADVRD